MYTQLKRNSITNHFSMKTLHFKMTRIVVLIKFCFVKDIFSFCLYVIIT